MQKKQITETLKLIDGTSVTVLEARMSRPPIASNTSGYNGVYLNKKSGRWTAQISFKSKNYYLGTFDAIQDAVQARQHAEKMLFVPLLERYYNGRNPDKAEKRFSVSSMKMMMERLEQLMHNGKTIER